MKFIENQVGAALSDIRSRIKGKVSPERAALNAMSKIDTAHNKKIQMPEGLDDDNDGGFVEVEDTSRQEYGGGGSQSTTGSGSGYSPQDSSLSVDYRGPRRARVLEKTSGSTIAQKVSGLERVDIGKNDVDHGILKKIVAKSSWSNDFIQAAVPSLLAVLPITSSEVSEGSVDKISLKLQLIKQIEEFKATLLSKQYLSEDVDNMAYMLCSFLDEKLTERGIIFETSLLVQFYKDAWGGEKCFDHLDHYLEKPSKNRDIIEFYDLFLSLGFLGKFGIIDQGAIILNNLRSELKAIVFPKPSMDLTHLLDYEILKRKGSLFTPLGLFLGLLLAFLILYILVSLYLHSLSRNLRNEIDAWQPPVLATIRDAPPPELASILQEGWLQIREHPLGWLLIFTSDGAFNVGSAELTKEFKDKKNLERLGNALANYPGDLVVIGHTDNTQYRKGKGSNLQLSIDRAKTVERELRSGTSINRYAQRNITSEGKGDSEPIASNATVQGRTKNRRVDILWKIGRKEKNEVLEILNNGEDEEINSHSENEEVINSKTY